LIKRYLGNILDGRNAPLKRSAIVALSRRIRACYHGVRAEMPPYGAQDLLDLELYLAWRANGLPLETPGVRR